ncbi:MAG: pyridoxal phosphate-dependent aminotransferase [Defluviitaleaceae bacterium]|nr:pyridoxal phosphate-dependent aminotransferase [Defluviitaleaceae bacterium]
MGKYDFDTLINRKGTYATKWDRMPEGNDKDALPLWVADMDFPTAEPILKAIHDRVDKGAFGYTYYGDEAKNAVTGWYLKRYGWQVENKDVFFCPGILPGIALLLNILSNEGDGIVIQPPVYHLFALKVKNNNRKVVNNPLIYKNGRYEMDYDDLDKKLTDPNNKGLLFCTPHNPSGRVWSEEELKKVVEIAKKHKKWIISDEIHADTVRKGIAFTPAAKLAGDYVDEIITLTAPSKAFNIAGLKISNLVITKKEYQDIYNYWVNDKLHIGGVNPLAMAANIAAYTEGEEWLEEANAYIDGNVDYCMEFFKKELPKSTPVYIEGTYLFWVDLNNYESDPKELERIMKQEAKVALNDGHIFGQEGNGFQRINLACPRPLLVECLNRMKDALVK